MRIFCRNPVCQTSLKVSKQRKARRAQSFVYCSLDLPYSVPTDKMRRHQERTGIPGIGLSSKDTCSCQAKIFSGPAAKQHNRILSWRSMSSRTPWVA